MSDVIEDYTFPRYLAAKRTVDDRALNHGVWQAMAELVERRQLAVQRRLEVLEIGAGIGTMVERTLDWHLFVGQQKGVAYTAIDAERGNVETAQHTLQDLPDWMDLRFATADVFEFVERPEAQARYDLLIAHAFLDLVDVPATLRKLRRLLRPGGIFYFTINFDGATIFQPEIDPVFDAQVETAYHQTMDNRITNGRPSGDSRTGRHMFGHLPQAGFRVVAAGSSDWVVCPLDGAYPADEAYFLHFIVHTIHGALAGRPAVGGNRLAAWIAERHAQIDRGELVYIAHQFDFCGTKVEEP
jgi:SAM-dependent methyltransferase